MGELGDGLPEPLKRLLMQLQGGQGMLPRPTQMGQAHTQPGQPPQPGRLGMLGAGQQPGIGMPPKALTPEQAAAERFEALKRAGQMPGQAGMFDGLTPSGPGRVSNMFAGQKGWHPGIFDTTNRLTPFDSFFVDDTQSSSWL